MYSSGPAVVVRAACILLVPLNRISSGISQVYPHSRLAAGCSASSAELPGPSSAGSPGSSSAFSMCYPHVFPKMIGDPDRRIIQDPTGLCRIISVRAWLCSIIPDPPPGLFRINLDYHGLSRLSWNILFPFDYLG